MTRLNTPTFAQIEAFERSVTRTDAPGACWGWRGGFHAVGYARVRADGSETTAARVSWFLEHMGEPMPPMLRHVCGNQTCTNPDHLQACEARRGLSPSHLFRRKPRSSATHQGSE